MSPDSHLTSDMSAVEKKTVSEHDPEVVFSQDNLPLLIAQKQYIMLEFLHCSRKTTADDVLHFSNKLVKMTESKTMSYAYKIYTLTNSSGKTLEVMVRQTSEDADVVDKLMQVYRKMIGDDRFRGMECYMCYLPKQHVDSKYIFMYMIINLDLVRREYRMTGQLDSNTTQIVKLCAMSPYTVHHLENCDNESEYTQISPYFRLKLFDYQSKSLSWMINIETGQYRFNVPKSKYFKVTENAYVQLTGKGEDVSLLSDYIYEADYEVTETLRCRGGILADIMGNGKTVTMIALIYHNRPVHPPLLTSLIEREAYIASRATLIVCPTNIASQWYSELAKCLGDNYAGLRIIKIATRTEMGLYSLRELVSADVIITTYAWMSHKDHIGTNFLRYGRANAMLLAQKEMKQKWGNQYEYYGKINNLLFLKYNRIVYDEFHEEIDSVNKRNLMVKIMTECLRAQSIWGMSGTPLLENTAINNNLPVLLQILDSRNEVVKLDAIGRHAVYQRFIRRNERTYLPPIHYRVVSVRQSVKERQLYESSMAQPSDVLLQLCCYHNIDRLDVSGIDDIIKNQNELRQRQLIELKREAEGLEANIKQIEGILRSMNSQMKSIDELMYLIDPKHPLHTNKLVLTISQTPGLRLQVENLKMYVKYTEQLNENRAKHDKLVQGMNYYDQTLKNKIVSGGFICPITGESVGDGEVVITRDGHLFSKSAIEMLFDCASGDKIQCPVSGRVLTRADIAVVSNTQRSDEKESTNQRLYGSKITCMIEEIQQLKSGEKVIIFASWDRLLHNIGSALKSNNINHVYIKGNVAIRDRSIYEFQTNPSVRVILLSAEFGASGVNLVEATHVYIVHPFTGVDGYQYERQAIGRAYRTGQTKPVTVSFFITENTIESDLWQENKLKYGL